MNGRFCIWRSPEFRYKLMSVLFPGMILSSSCFGESEIGQAPLGNRQILQSQFQEFRISSSLQYFPHSYFPVQPILIYPGVQWAYPCFPLSVAWSCSNTADISGARNGNSLNRYSGRERL